MAIPKYKLGDLVEVLPRESSRYRNGYTPAMENYVGNIFQIVDVSGSDHPGSLSYRIADPTDNQNSVGVWYWHESWLRKVRSRNKDIFFEEW